MPSEQEADHKAVDTADAGASVEEVKYLQEEEENESKILASSSNHETAGSTSNNIDVTRNKNTKWYAAPTLWQNENSSSHHSENDEWEHLFLDLFYVPAISNLSELLLSVVGDPDVRQEEVGEMSYEDWDIRGGAMLCFFAVFFAIWYSWYHQCVYECKYIARDTFHRLVNRGRLIFVAVSIYQISGYDELVDGLHSFSTDSRGNERSFYFCLGLTLECLISLLLRVEAFIMTRDDDGVVRKDSIVTDGFELCPRLVFYVAAWITHNNSEQWPWLVLCGALVPSIFLMLVQHFKYISLIPMSRQVFIPRIGSWVSIVIGEGIISLLNPGDMRRENDLISAVLGIFTLTIVHSIYFSDHGQISASEKIRGRLQTALIELLSIAFIGLGVASKQGNYIQNLLLDMRDIDKWKNFTGFNATMPEHPSDLMYSVTQSWYVLIDEPNHFEATTDMHTSEKFYPMIYRQFANKTFFICLPALLFFLEAIFWTSNPAYAANVRRLFQGEGGGKGAKTLVVSILVLQLAVLLAVAVAGNVNDEMMLLEPVYRHVIGFVLSAAFLLSRIIVVSVLK